MDMVDVFTPELEDEDNGTDSDPMAPVDLNGAAVVEEKSTDQTPIGEMVEDDNALEDLLTSGGSASSSGKIELPGGVRIRKVDERSYKSRHDLKVGVAFDYMRVKVKDIALLEKFTPALLKLYDQEKAGDREGEADEARDERGKSTMGVRNVKRSSQKTSGGGRMPRAKQMQQEKETVRNGSNRFDDRDAGEAKLAAANAA